MFRNIEDILEEKGEKVTKNVTDEFTLEVLADNDKEWWTILHLMIMGTKLDLMV